MLLPQSCSGPTAAWNPTIWWWDQYSLIMVGRKRQNGGIEGLPTGDPMLIDMKLIVVQLPLLHGFCFCCWCSPKLPAAASAAASAAAVSVAAATPPCRSPPPPLDRHDPRWVSSGVGVSRPRLRDLLNLYQQHLTWGRVWRGTVEP
jgi:hypothetical protein